VRSTLEGVRSMDGLERILGQAPSERYSVAPLSREPVVPKCGSKLPPGRGVDASMVNVVDRLKSATETSAARNRAGGIAQMPESTIEADKPSHVFGLWKLTSSP
jgi:hypothetical protein